MIRNMFFSIAISNMGMCQSESQNAQEPTPSGFSCDDHQLMIDVELYAIQSCTTADECTQQLDGLSCNCETGAPLLNASANPSYLYDLYDEAESYGCSVEIETECTCSELAEPTCSAGMCSWSE